MFITVLDITVALAMKLVYLVTKKTGVYKEAESLGTGKTI